MARVIITPLAEDDLGDIGEYLAKESRNRTIGDEFVDRIQDKARFYALNPQLGEECPDVLPHLRRFRVGHYVVFYLPLKDGIEVLRVLHGSRDVPAAWQARRES